MKITEGEFSLLRKKPTGLVAIVTKHMDGITKKRARSIARMIIEILGGGPNEEGQYEVEINIGNSSEAVVNVDLSGVEESIASLREELAEPMSKLAQRHKMLEQRIANLQTQLTELDARKANKRGRPPAKAS